MTGISFAQDNISSRMQRGLFVSNNSHYTGIDFIKVRRKSPQDQTCWRLSVYFFRGSGNKTQLENRFFKHISPANLCITTASGLPANLVAESLENHPGDRRLTVLLREKEIHGLYEPDVSGENSPGYCLEIQGVPGIDPFLTSATFYLRDTTSLAPGAGPSSAIRARPVTEIDYLCKDYASFRKLILDHLSLLVPDWKERHVPDLGIALVEIMAYAGDYLSYYQDAVGTEAYPGTARTRVSLARHARLRDYSINQGCNSRLLVQVQVENFVKLKRRTPLLTKIAGQDTRISTKTYKDRILHGSFGCMVFETMTDSQFFPLHNAMLFYTWGIHDFVLEKGTTTAALAGRFPHLRRGDILIIQVNDNRAVTETGIGPRFNHPLRLTRNPDFGHDPVCSRPVTFITWAEDDALPYRLVLSAPTSRTPDVVVLGNIVLADRGRTIPGEKLPTVPVQGEYYPRLKDRELIFAVPFDAGEAPRSARALLEQNSARAVPAVELYQYEETSITGSNRRVWTPRRHLLSSSRFARDFVVETGDDGSIYFRFGDGTYGQKPTPTAIFSTSYRVRYCSGNDVGPGEIQHIVTDDLSITGIYNPGSSSNYTRAETSAQVRINLPQVFKQQERCITAQDYADIAQRHHKVKEARVQIRGTGSWETAFLYLDCGTGKELSSTFKNEIHRFMEPFRPTGFDMEIKSPIYVPLFIELTVYLESGFAPEPVRQRLAEAFSNGGYPEGGSGFFYPGNFTFGQPVYLSRIIDRAMKIQGIFRVRVDRFRRFYQPSQPESRRHPVEIKIDPLEIARVDNDSRNPDRGIMRFRFHPRHQD